MVSIYSQKPVKKTQKLKIVASCKRVLAAKSLLRSREKNLPNQKLKLSRNLNVLLPFQWFSNTPYVTILDSLFEIWGKKDGPHGNISHGLMILYLTNWVMSNLINFQFLDKVHIFLLETFGTSKENYTPFVVFMAAAGVLRAANRSTSSGVKLDIVSRIKTYAIVCMEALVSDLVSQALRFKELRNDSKNRLLLQYVSLALVRSDSFSSNSSFFVCLALALLTEMFPLLQLYESVFSSGRLKLNEVKEHVDSILFKEAGVITGIFCNQYLSADEENKNIVENVLWQYCQDVYFGYRQVALLLKGKENELLEVLEKLLNLLSLWL